METQPKHTKSCCVFKSVNSASQLRWRLLRVAPEEEDDDADTLGRANAVKATIRKYLRRQSKRTRRAKVLVERMGASVGEEGPAMVCVRRHPAGAMAPENTTQYLMSNVYEDMKTSEPTPAGSHSTTTRAYEDALSPRSVYAALDANYDCCLAYQQRDFEQAYGLEW